MFVLRRFRLVVGCAALVAATAFAVHVVTQPVVAGRSITWGATAPGPAAPLPPGVATGTAPPSSSPPSSVGPLDGLRRPLGTLMQRLNADTAHNAAGQYSILQSLEHAVRDYVERFLNWITGRR